MQVVEEVLNTLFANAQRPQAAKKQSVRRERATAPCFTDDGWMTYAEAATLPGLSRTAVQKMVARAQVHGSEGMLEAMDLLRHLERRSTLNKQQAAAKELRRRLEFQQAR